MDRDDGQDEAYRLAGDRLGKFVILGELGRGSMGVVYEAFQEDLKRKVAVKVLPANIALDGKQVRRFRREAESASRLRHEQIIPIYEIGEFEGTHYFAMELVDGRPFGEGLGRDRESVREAARLARDAALGLAHAHERGVVHRDIKPGNLLVDRNGRLVVADFGLARLSESASLTSTDAIVGTPKYMSPEQILPREGGVDGRSDVYSLGATLYEAVTGRPAIEAPSVQAYIRAVLEERPPSPRRFNREVPHDLATILLRCLEKDPDERYQSAADLAADLDRFLAGERIHARPKGTAAIALETVRRHKVIAALTTLFVIALSLNLVLSSRATQAVQEGDFLAELRSVVEEDDPEKSLARMEKIVAEHPDRPDVRDTARAVRRRHAAWLLERPQPDFARALADLEAAEDRGTFWHLMLLVETGRMEEAREHAQLLPGTKPLRTLALARAAFEEQRPEEARDLLATLPDDAHAYAYLTRGLALRTLAAEADDPVQQRALLEAARADLAEAQERSRGMREEWLRSRIAYWLSRVSNELGLRSGLGDLFNAFGGMAEEALRGLTTFWRSMTRSESANVEAFVRRVLDLQGLRPEFLPVELEERAQAILASDDGSRVVANLILAVARMSRGELTPALEALENAEADASPDLVPYVYWGQSLLYRAQGNLVHAMQFAVLAIEAAAPDCPDAEPLARNAFLLAEQAAAREESEAAAERTYDFLRRLAADGRLGPELTGLLPAAK